MATSNLQYAKSFKSLFFSQSLPFIFVFNLLHFNSRQINLLKRFLMPRHLKFLFLRKNIATNLLFPHSSLSHVFQGPVCVIYPNQSNENFMYQETVEFKSISKLRESIMYHFNIFLFLFVRKQNMFLGEPELKKMEFSKSSFFTQVWTRHSFFLTYSLYLIVTQLNKMLFFPIFLISRQSSIL